MYQQSLENAKEAAASAWDQYVFHAFLCFGFGLFALIYAILKSKSTSERSINLDHNGGRLKAHSVFQAQGEIHWVKLSDKQLKRIAHIKRLPLVLGAGAILSLAS